MSYAFDWHNLPPDIRLGGHPDEEMTLYRGFKYHQLDPARGMFSSALRHNRHELVDDVIDAVENRWTAKLIEHISIHADNLEGNITPFVSATPELPIAERYARRPGEMVATLLVRADQIVMVPMLPYEALVIGFIGLHSIVGIEESPIVI